MEKICQEIKLLSIKPYKMNYSSLIFLIKFSSCIFTNIVNAYSEDKFEYVS